MSLDSPDPHPVRPRRGCKAGRPISIHCDEADLARFRAAITPVGDCLIWGDPTRNDYAQFSCRGRTERAHRFAYAVFKGPIPPGMGVSHACDRRNCVNPEHLQATPQRTNMLDAARKGRIRTFGRGGAHPQAKLDDRQRDEVRARCRSGETQRAVAEDYGVLQPAISKIVNEPRRPEPARREGAKASRRRVRSDDWAGLILQAAGLGLESLGHPPARILAHVGRLESILAGEGGGGA